MVDRWPPWLRRVVARSGLVRAVLLLVCGRRYAAIAKIRGSVGWRTVLLLSAFSRSPKIVVLHFIEQPPRSAGWVRLLDRAWAPLDRWATRRAVISAQVLCAWEVELYARRFRVEASRFRFVPFAWRRAPRGAAPQFRSAGERTGVIAAGRNSCDWATLFQAAEGADWPLTVVCQGSDRANVDRLNSGRRAAVFSDLPTERVQEMLGEAAVSVMVVHDRGISQGHVRLCAAVDAGTPVVASRIRSLSGYVEDGRTAVLVAPGDAPALREAIERLLADPAARDDMARAAWERAGQWTWDDYLAAIATLLGEAGGDQAQAAASAEAESAEGSDDNRREITFDTPSPPIETP